MRTTIIGAGLAILALVVSACSNDADSLLRRGNIEDPATLDPALAQDVHTFNVLTDLYEGLVANDAAGQLVPGVAESWTVSDDGLRYTFALRRDARWSNGDAVTSADFVRSLRYVANPDTPAPYAFLLEAIENFSAVKAGDKDADALGIEATDPWTVTIRLHKSLPYFLTILAMPIAYPQHAEATTDEAIGNGAYRILQRELGSSLLLGKNPEYWNAASVAVERVEYVAVADEIAEFNMYRAGELDITAVIPASHIDIARTEFPGEVRIAPELALYYLAFDLTEPPFSNLVVREALSLAVDRSTLVDLIGRGEQAAYGIVPTGTAHYAGYRYEWQSEKRNDRLRRARQLLADAGYGVDKPLAITYLYDAGGIHERIALAVTSMWRDNLGVEVQLEKREWQHFLDSREQREDWDVMRFAWFGDYNDATTFLDIFASNSEQNLPRYDSHGYDALLERAGNLKETAARADVLKSAERTLLHDYAVVPLYFYVSKHLVRPEIRGFENNALDRHPTQYLARER